MSSQPTPDSIYVVDECNQPLAIMDSDDVHLQGLWHRGFLLLLVGRAGRVVLRRCGPMHPLYPGQWDVFGQGHILVGKSARERAEACLPGTLKNAGIFVRHVFSQRLDAGSGHEFVEIFVASLSEVFLKMLCQEPEFMVADQDELSALVQSYPDQLTPALLTAYRARLFAGIGG